MQRLNPLDGLVVWGSIFLVCCRIIWFFPAIPTAMYYVLMGVLAMLVVARGCMRIHGVLALFLIFCFLSILANTIPAYYHVYERYLGMLLIVAFIGPLVGNEWAKQIKEAIFYRMGWVLVAITVVSFILYFVNKPLAMGYGGLYSGITVHSMTMGPLSGLALEFIVNYLFQNKDVLKRNHVVLLSVVAFACFGSCVLAGSRAALLAAIGSVLLWVWLFTSDIVRFLRTLFVVLFVTAATFPVWWSYTETIQNKMKYAQEQGSLSASRDGLWSARIDEFRSSPILGIGFATISSENVRASVNRSGGVEPGNGWLFVLSSTGIVSFLFFVVLYMRACWRLYRIRDGEAIIYLCFLFFFLIHMIAEGYTLSAGSPLFFLLWLSLGASYAYLDSNRETL